LVGVGTPKGAELAIPEEFALNCSPVIFIEVLVALIVIWLIVIAV
jgi:hypothetical protein